MPLPRSARLLLALSSLAAPAALAQQGPPVPAEGDDPPGAAQPAAAEEKVGVSADLTFFALHILSSGFDGAPGDVSVSRAGAELGVNIALDKRRSLSIGFGAMHSWYEFDGATGFVSDPDGPWSNVTELDVNAGFRGAINDRWGYLLGVNANASFESGADFGDSTTFGGRAGFTYQVSDRAVVGLGVAVSTRLEDDALFLPFPVLSWQFAEQWKLATYGDSRGTGLGVSYMPCETWTLTLRAGVGAHEFRLDETGPQPDGVGRSWHLPVELIAEWKVDPQVKLMAGVGVEVWQQYTLDDSAGDEVAEFDADPSFLFGVGAEFTF